MASSNLLLRVLTAAVLIPIVLVLVLWAPQVLFVAFLVACGLLAIHEYLGLASQSGLAPLRIFSYVVVVLLIAWPRTTAGFHMLLVLVALTLVMLPFRSLEKALAGSAASVLGVLYIGMPLAILGELRQLPNGPRWVIYALVLTWVSDTAAYFAGRAFGRHQLSPRVSPGKTWEGAAGSLAAALLFGVLYLAWLMPEFRLGWSLATSGLVNVAGQVGDLAESALKRGAGAKDSSSLLPGHGGFLDRIDALLFAVPALWYILSVSTARFFAPLP